MPSNRTEALNDRAYISASKAAKVLGVHRDTVIRRAFKGKYRYRLIDDVPYVLRRDIEKAAKLVA